MIRAPPGPGELARDSDLEQPAWIRPGQRDLYKRTREDKAKTPTDSPARDTGKRPTVTRAAARWLRLGRRNNLPYIMAGENWQVALHRGKHWQLESCETCSNMNPRVSRAKTGTLGPKIGHPGAGAPRDPDLPLSTASSSLGIDSDPLGQRSAPSYCPPCLATCCHVT